MRYLYDSSRWFCLTLLVFFISISLVRGGESGSSIRRDSIFEDENNDDSNSNIVTMPLVPHHVQKTRRRLEALQSVNSTEESHEMHRRWLKEKERHEELRRHYPRNRHLQQDGMNDESNFHPEQIAELYQGYGTHYVDLWCGSPTPQRQTVIVDTGSGVTAFPCSGCGTDCGVPKYHAGALFVEDDSTTFSKLTCDQCLRGTCRKYGNEECHIGMSYQEGSSWSAYEAMDRCYVGGPHVGAKPDNGGQDDMDPFHAPAFAFDMKFGCQTHLTGLFITQLADGIMGMDNAASAYWRQMYEQHVIKKRAFSLCFNRHDKVDRKGTESGAMTLGGTDRRLHKTPMVYSSTGGKSGFFAIELRNIYLRPGSGGISAASSDPAIQPVPLGMKMTDVIHGQVIVDSGTTDTYFTRALAPYFKKVWKDMTGGQDYDHNKVHLTDAELDALPTILFQLRGDANMNTPILEAATGSGQNSVVGLANIIDPDHPYDVIIAMPARHYLEYDDDDQTWTARFYTDESGSGGVLGANMMMGHDLLFDIENARIGWAEADCDYSTLIQQYGSSFVDGGGGSSSTPATPATPAEHEDGIPPNENGGGGSDTEPPSLEDDDEYEEEDDDLAPEMDDNFEDTTTSETKKHKSNEAQEGLPQTDDEPILPDSQFCSSLTCQGGIVLAVLVVVVFGAVRLLRSPAGGAYEVADAELELKTGTNGVAVAMDDDDGGEYGGSSNGNGVHYRDEPTNGDAELPDIS